MKCKIKIDELYKRLTMQLMCSESYAELYDWLDLSQEQLFEDIKMYVELNEGDFKTKKIEENISNSLDNLMNYYENEWTVMVSDKSGGEIEMNLYDAMKMKNIHSFQTGWTLKEINKEWSGDDVTLVDEEDDWSLDDYYTP